MLIGLTNPVSLLTLLALLTPLVEATPPSPGGVAALLGGIFVAASLWWVCVSFAVASLRARLSPRVLAVLNACAATIMTIYGALALARSAGL